VERVATPNDGKFSDTRRRVRRRASLGDGCTDLPNAYITG